MIAANRYATVSHCLNLHFLKTHEMDLLFTCLFTICISSLVKYMLRSLTHCLIGLLVFLRLSFKSSLYSADNKTLSDVSLTITFSQSVACFHSPDTDFPRTEFLIESS